MTDLHAGTAPTAPTSTAVRRALPRPTRTRWQPLRLGLTNLYRYDQQEFHFEDGRLLLRGNNGTGKSRVVALTLPFLLDGDTSPHRVEPDGDQAKRIEWNLLLGQHDDRLGYAWLEFGRREDDGTPHYVTIGCGMRAVAGRGAPTKWFFVTDQRVGEDLALVADTGQALTRERLREALTVSSAHGGAADTLDGDGLLDADGPAQAHGPTQRDGASDTHVPRGGEIHDTGAEYRRAVDRALFGLGETRYGALVDLLIQLRRPQLSRQLDEGLLSEALSEALPPLDPAVVADVAEAFRRLDDDRDEVDGFRSALAATDRFLDAYRTYAAVALRRRVGEVTAANSRYEDTRRRLTAEETRRDEERARADGLAADLSRLDGQVDDAETAIGVLEASPEMDRVRELDAARSRETELAGLADERAADAETAQQLVARREEEHHRAELAATASRADTEAALDAADQAAAAVGRHDEHRSALAQVGPGREAADDAAAEDVPHGDGPDDRPADIGVAVADGADVLDGARRALEQLTGGLDEQIAHLRGLAAAAGEAAAELHDARRDLARREAELDHAGEDARDADDAVAAAHDDLLAAYRRWADDVSELAPASSGDIAEALADWTGEGTGPVSPAVASAADVAVARLASLRGAVDRDRAETEAVRDDRRAERAAVAEGRHEPPAPHPARDIASRTDRPGAPLWQLVDWHDDVPSAARAGYEAALEAAGILDAWVTPDGRLIDADDAVLVPAGTTADAGPARDLSTVLRPDVPDGATPSVPAASVAAILRTIGAEADDGAAGAWVAADGRYRIGPVSGRFRKEEAGHVGHAAREAARAARLRELDDELAGLDAALAAIDARAGELDDREARLTAEREAAPTEEPLRTARHAATLAHRRVEGLRGQLAASERAVTEAHQRLDAATAERDRDAADLGLAAWIGRLDELAQAVGDYRIALAGLWPRLASHHDTVERLRSAQRELTDARAAWDDARGTAAEAHARAREAATRRGTLEATIGEEVEAILARLEDTRHRRDELRQQRASTRQERDQAEVDARVAGERIADLTQQVDDHAALRTDAVERLRHAVVADLPEVAAPELADESAPDEPGTWAADPAVRSARRIDRQLADVAADDDRWRRVAGDIFGHFQDLEHALLPHTIQPTASHDDDLFVVSIPFQGVTHSVAGLQALLSDELDTRRSLLDAREREVLENHLVGEVATQLHELIRAGETLVAEMNAEIEQRPTSTGMRLRFAWRPREDGPAAFADARRRLLSADDVWSPADREALGAFLQERIREVREADDTGTWAEHLARALDYRRWHLFLVERQQDGTWVRLTRRTHGTGSGGEKALALTIPQFAAAAAHYRSAAPEAPRLIALDEAFVGIDSDMRAKCMDLLTRFDLDVVMTSEREWACYPTVPGIAIYQLSTRPGIDAVGVHRWVWNGRNRLAVTEETPAGAVP